MYRKSFIWNTFTAVCFTALSFTGRAATINVSTETALRDAITNVSDGDTIKLIANITLSYQLEINNGKTFTLNTNGDTLDFNWFGLDIYNSSNVTFDGNIINAGAIGVNTNGIGKCEVVFNGNITVKNGIAVELDAEVTVNGSITSAVNNGVGAYDNAKVTVNGDITAATTGIYADGNAEVTVRGNISNIYNYGGIIAHANAKIIVSGNIDAVEEGVTAEDNAEITVMGNIISGSTGAIALNNAKIIVGGDITAYTGVHIEHSSIVVVNGIINATDYIYYWDGSAVYLTASQYNTPHDNAGYDNYFEYKCKTSATDSAYVYVLDPNYAYSVTVQDDGNGTGNANPASAVAGTLITLTATATSSGYVFDRWEVIAGGVSIANNTFTMPSENVTVKVYFKQNVGIVGAGSACSIQVYPNPTNGQLRIENYEISMGEIEIIDVVGRVVETHCNASLPIIDISHLENGLYFLKIGDKIIKIIKN